MNRLECVQNVSSRPLSNDEERLLGKGLNFGLKHTKKDALTSVATVEEGITGLKDVPLHENEHSDNALQQLSVTSPRALTSLKKNRSL